jgi:hypothetical protein
MSPVHAIWLRVNAIFIKGVKMAQLPEFKNEKEWVDFFDTHDMGEYLEDMIPVDPKEFRIVRRRKTAVLLELPSKQIEKVRELAKRQKKPPQKMLQQWLSQRLRDELAAM